MSPESGLSTLAISGSPLTDDDLYLFNEGSHHRLWEKLGAHPAVVEGKAGTHFAVWAPDARSVSLIGDFNSWTQGMHPLRPRGSSGIWELFVPGIGKGAIYKFHVASRANAHQAEKADPFALCSEEPPRTASVVWDLDYSWEDQDWMERRYDNNGRSAPWSIYEMHLGSWMRVPEEGNRSLSYREMAPRLIAHLTRLGFTHVEFLPVMEHPFYGSWGYQTTSYFAPTRRYGDPQDLMFLIDQLHQAEIGVILDWVPSHFPADVHGLGYFDGTHLYEHADPRLGFHPDWKSYIFNYGRNEVQSFLRSSALFWLDEYHADGLRVDGVASMLYRDYSRKPGEWIPNAYGGRENVEAINLLRNLNSDVYRLHGDTQTIAEESTDWPMVSKPVYLGGLGFGMKWDLGWMHDTLDYIRHDPIHRRYHHNSLTFRGLYAFHENFVLPLSHDEVVHGKGSLLSGMPGDDWQKFANLRLLMAYMYALPGKKLLFMGAEIGQWSEWHHDDSLDWHLLQYESHAGLERWLSDLNQVYRSEPSLHQLDFDPHGFEWVDCSDSEHSVVSLIRKGFDGSADVLGVFNFTPVPRHNYRIGISRPGWWQEILNSDATVYWGSGQGNFGGAHSEPIPWHGRPQSLNISVPPLGGVFFRNG
ncbi:MAG TPA: 1,4-alpha-glucan branching protein GlgB [Candidatus Dormibacteraeota bacterium]|nr:1,4-alpha-glucan branching protein GlgB [Candidatus Dormibacteraeota bacterium]